MVERTHFLTPEGRRKLEEELEFLRTTRRQEIAESLRSAVEEGDLTEDAGYEEMKREQAFVEGRIRDIESILHGAQTMPENGNHERVALGVRITVAEEGGDPETYQIVGRAEADPLNGRISNESPLGRALMGRCKGDTVQVQTPSGMVQFQIIAIN